MNGKIKNKNYKKNKIKLTKYNDYENISVKFSKYKVNSNTKEDIIKFKDIINDFFETLNKNCKVFPKKQFINNLENACFDIFTSLNDSKFIPDELRNLDFSGLCTFSEESISFYANNSSNAYHELMHLAAFKFNDSLLCSGFEMYNDTTNFAYALNEGYTEFLTQKFFKEKIHNPYKFEVNIANLLEIIIGEEKMQNIYFNENLFSLFTAINKYNDANSICNFIVNFDNIFDDRLSEKNNYQDISICVKEIYLFLIKILINRVNAIEKNNVTLEDIRSIMYLYDKNNWIGKIKLYDKYELNLLDINEYSSYLNEVNINLNELEKKVS